jgi:hypothetical protein
MGLTARIDDSEYSGCDPWHFGFAECGHLREPEVLVGRLAGSARQQLWMPAGVDIARRKPAQTPIQGVHVRCPF